MKEDRIRELPDSLLCQILSYLTTKDAVRTSVLSTRWRSVWLQIPELALDSSEFPGDDAFISFVDRFLDFDSELPLQKFELRYDVVESRLKPWINAVVKRKIQHLGVHDRLWFGEKLKMPQTLYSCETLVRLELSNVVLNNPEFVSLPCLKVMCLESVQYANDLVVEVLISSCPALEDLFMNRHFSDSIKVLHVHSKTLKNFCLQFDFFETGKEHGVVIDAPGLECLSIRDHQSGSFDINMLDPSVKLNIDVNFNVDLGTLYNPADPSEINSIHTFLTMISGVIDMSIGCNTLDVIYFYSRRGQLPQFYNLCYLRANDFWLEYLLIFLKSCPNLKSLFLRPSIFREEEDTILSSVPQCLLSSLEFVEIQRPLTGKGYRMKLARYFLKNSAVLKKLTLSLGTPKVIEESVVLEELLSFPRLSTTCEVVVC